MDSHILMLIEYSSLFTLLYSSFLYILPYRLYNIGSLVNAIITSTYGFYELHHHLNLRNNSPFEISYNTCDEGNVFYFRLVIASFIGYLIADLLVSYFRIGECYCKDCETKIVEPKQTSIVIHHLIYFLYFYIRRWV